MKNIDFIESNIYLDDSIIQTPLTFPWDEIFTTSEKAVNVNYRSLDEASLTSMDTRKES